MIKRTSKLKYLGKVINRNVVKIKSMKARVKKIEKPKIQQHKFIIRNQYHEIQD